MAYISAIAYTMIETNTDTKIDKLQSLSTFFKAGNTRDYNFRKQQLLNLKKAILDNHLLERITHHTTALVTKNSMIINCIKLI